MKSLSACWARLLLGCLAALAILAFSENAQAYAWMIRHEYTGCTQCHADPSGGSLLTLYGRAQGEIVLRTPYAKRGEDWDPGKGGNFLFGAFDLPEELLLGADVRNLYLYSKTAFPSPQPSPPKISRFIFMQGDFVGQLTVDRFRANGSVGYAYEGALGASLTRGGDKTGRAVSRVHWVGVDIGEDKEVLLRAGRMNIPFGLRHIEHTMWVRAATRTDINAAQDHGVALSYNAAKIRAEVMGIAGNFQIRPDDFRDRGYAGYVEYAPLTKLAFGGSSMIVHADNDLRLGTQMWRHAHGIFGRYSPFEQLVLLTEVDMTLQSQPPNVLNSHRTQGGIAGMLQADGEVYQGVHLIVAGEMLDQELARGAPSYGIWGGAQWFFAPHADARVDAIYQTTPIGGGQSAGTTSLLAQFHVYL